MDQIKSSPIFIQVVFAALLYNLLHMFAWELPMAIKFGWKINVIGDVLIISISTMSIILISFRKKNRANCGNDTCSMGGISSMVLSLYRRRL